MISSLKRAWPNAYSPFAGGEPGDFVPAAGVPLVEFEVSVRVSASEIVGGNLTFSLLRSTRMGDGRARDAVEEGKTEANVEAAGKGEADVGADTVARACESSTGPGMIESSRRISEAVMTVDPQGSKNFSIP